jgi:hypothetical protein
VDPLPPKTPPYHLRDRDEAMEAKHRRLLDARERANRALMEAPKT